MLKRIVTGTSIALATVLLLWGDAHFAPFHGVYGLSLLFVLGCPLGYLEVCNLAQARGQHPDRTFALILAGLLPVLVAVTGGDPRWHVLGLGLAIVCVMVRELARGPVGAVGAMTSTVFGLVYAWFLPSFLVVIEGQRGVAALVWVIGSVKLGDVGAYFTGRMIGRTPLIPRISPGKTLEGTLGGLVATGVFAWGFQHCVPEAAAGLFPSWALVPAAVCISALGMLGDLVESLLKRDAGVKDSGALFPGSGGVLDVSDSLVTSAPLAAGLLLWNDLGGVFAR